MYRILNNQVFPTLKQKQILPSVIVVTDLRKTTPTYCIYIIYIKSRFFRSAPLFVWTTISNICLRKDLTHRYNENKLIKTLFLFYSSWTSAQIVETGLK